MTSPQQEEVSSFSLLPSISTPAILANLLRTDTSRKALSPLLRQDLCHFGISSERARLLRKVKTLDSVS